MGQSTISVCLADISFLERAWEEFQYWMGQDKKTVKRITALKKRKTNEKIN